jgi:hypothetical protein
MQGIRYGFDAELSCPIKKALCLGTLVIPVGKSAL